MKQNTNVMFQKKIIPINNQIIDSIKYCLNENYKIIIIILISTFIICFFLFTKIIVKVKKHKKSNIELIISKLFHFSIDIDEFIVNKINKFDFSQININELNNKLLLLKIQYPLIKYLMKRITINKITIIPKWNVVNPFINSYLIFLSFNINSIIKNYIDNNFKRCLNEYYQVIIDYRNINGILIDLEVELRIYDLIIIFFKNIAIFKKVKLFKKNSDKEIIMKGVSLKRIENERTSNK